MEQPYLKLSYFWPFVVLTRQFLFKHFLHPQGFTVLKLEKCRWMNSILFVTDSKMYIEINHLGKPLSKNCIEIAMYSISITVEGWMVNSKEGVITQFQRRPPKNTKSDTFQQTLFPQSSRDSLIEVIFCWSSELAFFSLFTKASL